MSKSPFPTAVDTLPSLEKSALSGWSAFFQPLLEVCYVRIQQEPTI